MKRPAFFLDRDGTINFDPGYISHPDLIELLPGVAAAIRRARDAGFTVVVVTNQSGVGRGIIAPEALPKIHARLNELLEKEAGARVDYFASCVHAPFEQCDCRKPHPRLVLEAEASLGLDLKRSAFVGDRLTDVATGRNAGCRFSVLVRSGDGREQEAMLGAAAAGDPRQAPDHVADHLRAAVDWVLARSGAV